MQRTISYHSLQELDARVDRASLLNREPGRIAVAVPFLACRVIPLVFCVRKRLGFGGGQLCIVTSFLSLFAGRVITLLLRQGCLFGLRCREFGVITLFPAVGTILRVALAFCAGDGLCVRGSQPGMIAEPAAVLAVSCIELPTGGVDCARFRCAQF